MTIKSSTVTGEGASPYIAQNGIQISFGRRTGHRWRALDDQRQRVQPGRMRSAGSPGRRRAVLRSGRGLGTEQINRQLERPGRLLRVGFLDGSGLSRRHDQERHVHRQPLRGRRARRRQGAAERRQNQRSRAASGSASTSSKARCRRLNRARKVAVNGQSEAAIKVESDKQPGDIPGKFASQPHVAQRVTGIGADQPKHQLRSDPSSPSGCGGGRHARLPPQRRRPCRASPTSVYVREPPNQSTSGARKLNPTTSGGPGPARSYGVTRSSQLDRRDVVSRSMSCASSAGARISLLVAVRVISSLPDLRDLHLAVDFAGSVHDQPEGMLRVQAHGSGNRVVELAGHPVSGQPKDGHEGPPDVDLTGPPVALPEVSVTGLGRNGAKSAISATYGSGATRIGDAEGTRGARVSTSIKPPGRVPVPSRCSICANSTTSSLSPRRGR